MTPADDPVKRYHALLGHSTIAADSWGVLSEELKKHGLYFGTRPLCNVLRPRFLTAEQRRLIDSRSNILATALRRMQEIAIAEPAIRSRFRLLDWEEELLDIQTRFSHPCPITRFDGFIADDGRLRFTEINAQSPAGAGFTDAMTNAFRKMPVMDIFSKTYPMVSLPTRSGVLASLLSSYRDWAGNSHEPPRLAIVDWEEVPTRSDFVLLQEHFREEGHPTRILSPHDLEFDGRQLTAHGEPITLVYRRVLMVELISQCGMNHPLIQASRAGAVCVVNPISCRLPGKKASFAFLSDEENGDWFTPVQRSAIRDNIPWTRFVEERKTQYGGQVVDLIPFIIKNKDRLVLKPNDSYGGRAVVLGWMVDPAAWDAAVTAALAEPYIVQERIQLPTEIFPSWENDMLLFAPRWLDTCPFMGADDNAFGCLTRLSTLPLVNVTAGGGAMVPTMIFPPASTP
ncbi:circularly permuted type 2 ATP-grasp protein [Limnoglobus roseus]|nr:circularly permuted type 2 ATP-grasp protein [Limnoglobus roseus]